MMFRNYLIIAIRNLLNQAMYTGINVLGMAAGLACFLLIALFVHHELSYDRQWRNTDRIYQIARDYYASGDQEESRLDAMPAPAAALLKQEFPEIEQVARYMCCGVNGALANGDPFTEPAYADADNSLFEIFDFEWVSGDPSTALTEPFDLVLTESAARKYFGAIDPMGQTLMLQWGPPSVREPRIVKGVIKDLPQTSHFSFEMLGSMLSWLAVEETAEPFNSWNYNAFQTYVLLREGTDANNLQNSSGQFFDKYFESGSSASTGFTVIPAHDIYLRSDRANIYNNPQLKQGSLANVYIFSAIGVFILLLACINFVNLATACSARRSREIGVRKAMGASQQAIRLQFLTESVMLVVLAVMLSIVIVELALPWFNNFMLRDLAIEYPGNSGVLVVFALLVIGMGIITASYPAFYLAQVKATRAMRGDVTRETGGAFFRKALITLQFSITIALLAATAVVYAQMRFARNVELGYETEQIVMTGVNVQPQRWNVLKQEWLRHPEIISASKSMPAPFADNDPGRAEMRAAEQDTLMRNMDFMMVDADFFETYEITPLAGRTFSEAAGDRPVLGEDGVRTTSFIINQSAVQQFGWDLQDALGKWLELQLPEGSLEWGWAGNAQGPVIGVVNDVYWESAHSSIQPLVYRMLAEGQGGVASIRITDNWSESTLAWIDEQWKLHGPAFPIQRSFLSQDFANLYQTEQRQGQMLAFFSVLALLISCLGLFGLSAYMTERRYREIGVRKVMGGSVWSIVLLLTNDFSKLVLLSNLIAWPVAYFAMERWLENFAYRIDLTPLVFIGSGLIALCIAWVTVGGTAAKAASAKPVLALRYE